MRGFNCLSFYGRWALACLGLAWALPLLAQTPAPPFLPPTLQNGDFHDGEPGQAPKGWILSKASQDAGFRCEVAEDPSGQRCAILMRESDEAYHDGSLAQSVDVTAYRGKRIRWKGQLRMESQGATGSRAELWLRMGRRDCMGFNAKQVVRASIWTPVELVGDVPVSAEKFMVGCFLHCGKAKVWIRSLALEVLGDAPGGPPEGPRALTSRGLQNLEAFTRALSYIRFFHPSKEAAGADWNHLAAAGVRAVEGAGSAQELADRMQKFFAPYAPSAQFLAPGRRPTVPMRPTRAVYLVRWRHVGVYLGDPRNVYKSSKEYLPWRERARKGWADPRDTSTLKLSRGLSLWLPSVCFADSGRITLPHARKLTVSVALPEPTEGLSGDSSDRATRLGDVVLAWGILQHFFPYFDVVKTDWRAELPKALCSAALDPDGEAFMHTLLRMMATLKDSHGKVESADKKTWMYPSLGITLLDGRPVVQYAGESAKQVPLGSQILSLDGKPSEAILAAMRLESCAASEGSMNAGLADNFLRWGPKGTLVKVMYRAPSGALGEATLPCDAWASELKGKRLEVVAELKPGVWYVDLGRISDAQFEKALPSLIQGKGVIFDLRGYRNEISINFLRHLTDQSVESPRLNIPVVTQPDGKNWEWDTSKNWSLTPLPPRIPGKVAFLTGGGAQSADETFLGIVEAYKLAEIVGEPTAGTNGNVNPFTLPGGYTITWTGMKVLKHDGSIHHGVGILPTVPVKPTIQGLVEGRDEVLEKGIEVVSR